MTWSAFVVAVTVLGPAVQQPPPAPPILQEPQTLMLWDGRAPGAQGDEDRDKPALTVYMPPNTTGPMTAVIIAPGGSYQRLSMNLEGREPANHFDAGNLHAADPIDRVSSRPDFAILAYPVISFIEPWTHQGSKTALLGDAPDPAFARSLSSETQVTAATPPAFIYHTNADTIVPVENAVAYFLALRKAGVPAEMHVFKEGRHGTGLGMTDPALSEWPTLLANWLRVSGFLR